MISMFPGLQLGESLVLKLEEMFSCNKLEGVLFSFSSSFIIISIVVWWGSILLTNSSLKHNVCWSQMPDRTLDKSEIDEDSILILQFVHISFSFVDGTVSSLH